MRALKSVTVAGGLIAALLSITVPGRANITPLLDSITPLGSEFLWSYDAHLDTLQELNPGTSKFVIVDFEGYVPGSGVAPVGWAFSTIAVDPLVPPLSITDSAGIVDLVWTYVGPTFSDPADGETFSGFSARSTFGSIAIGDFAASATSIPLDPLETKNKGPVQVPALALVPEPGTMTLLGLGGAASLLCLRRRNRKS